VSEAKARSVPKIRRILRIHAGGLESIFGVLGGRRENFYRLNESIISFTLFVKTTALRCNISASFLSNIF